MLGGKCVDCGYDEHLAALEFDHLGDKEFDIGTWLTGSPESVLAEVRKCEVVCARCHRIRTHNRSWRVVERKIYEYEKLHGSLNKRLVQSAAFKLKRISNLLEANKDV